jgi:predicted permease
MIFALGYKLAEIKITHISRSILFGGLRIFLGFIFSLLAIKILNIEGLLAKVIILQASMPPAIFNFVLAEKYKQNSQAVASIILAGTLISVVTLPLIVAYLLR